VTVAKHHGPVERDGWMARGRYLGSTDGFVEVHANDRDPNAPASTRAAGLKVRVDF
jgi:hypothetical protein